MDMPYGPKIILWALAGQAREGYYLPGQHPDYPDGSRSYRNCNPGNLKFSHYSVSLGATKSDDGGFAIFPNYVSGFFALCQLLSDACRGNLKSYDPNGTLRDFYNIYAPTADKNDPNAYAVFISQHAALPLDVPIKTFLS